MKSALIAVALAFGIGVSATVTIEHSPDGSFRAISKPDAPAAARRKFARSAACLPCRDKCAGAASAAPEFCESFLAATYTAPADFAPLETQCASDAGRVSSACSCFLTPTPSTSTTSTPSTESSSAPSATPTGPTCGAIGAPCTLSGFIQECCGAADGSKGCYFPTGDPNAGICFI